MSTLRRRAASVPGLFLVAVLLVVLLPIWLPLAALADLIRGHTRLPTVRLLAFGLCWAWLESIGVATAGVFWLTGQRRNRRLHLALQRWWAARLIGSLAATTGIRIAHSDVSNLTPGPAVLLCRHASLADSLVSAYLITTVARMNPCYVLKRELLADPCLDIVGNRLNNHFLDRGAPDSGAELAALRELSSDLQADEIAVIFPEGTRANPAKRARALEKIGQRDPDRAARLAGLRHLLPPRPAGSLALLEGCPSADVVIGWHVGFDGLDRFGGILRYLATTPRPVQFESRRINRADVPGGDAFTAWLDGVWLEADEAVQQLLHSEGTP